MQFTFKREAVLMAVVMYTPIVLLLLVVLLTLFLR